MAPAVVVKGLVAPKHGERGLFDDHFAQADAQKFVDAEAARIQRQKESWAMCWRWTPRVGEPASFNCVIAVDTNGKQYYVYMSSVIIRELTDRDCLVQTDWPEDWLPDRNGKLFRISLADLWPNIKHENLKQRQQKLVAQPKAHWQQRLLVTPKHPSEGGLKAA